MKNASGELKNEHQKLAASTSEDGAVAELGLKVAAAETIPQHEASSNMLAKLARIFAHQVETLRKHRSTGGQTIKIERVTVNDGGQAIVGNVGPGGRGQF